MKKIISLALAVIMLLSVCPMVYAADVDYSQGTQVVYEATGTESYTITVPALLAPGGSGTVTLSGTWADNRTITVTADPDVTLTNSIKAEDQKVLDVYFDGISEAGSNTGSQTFTETVSVAEITNALFGTWSGKFNYNVEITNVFHYGDLYVATAADGTLLSLVIHDDGSAQIYQNSLLVDSAPVGAVVLSNNNVLFAGETVGYVSMDATQIVTVESEALPGFGGLTFSHFPLYFGAEYRLLGEDGTVTIEVFYVDGSGRTVVYSNEEDYLNGHYVSSASMSEGSLWYHADTLTISFKGTLDAGTISPDGTTLILIGNNGSTSIFYLVK